jgi:hypothetical protein
MVEISKCTEPCFAEMNTGCKILTAECEGRCVFYKPASCKDWIKKEIDGKEWIIPPEEYYPDSRYYENM